MAIQNNTNSLQGALSSTIEVSAENVQEKRRDKHVELVDAIRQIDVLNEAPDQIRYKCASVHRLLNEIAEHLF